MRLVGLVSGGGTTLANWLDVQERGELLARVVGVVSSRARGPKNERILARCDAKGIPVTILPRKDYPDEQAYSEAVTAAVDPYEPDLVGLAGWLWRWLFPLRYAGKVLNIHPALLPRFGGKGCYGHHVHEAVLEAGEAESGCTVHFADHGYDTGPIILQRRVPVLEGDTPEALQARVFEQECLAYPEAINRIARGEVVLPPNGEENHAP